MTSSHPATPTARARVVGFLLAGALGDALGGPIEFASLADIRRAYGSDGVTTFLPEYGRTGAITDDTQMTLFTAEGLLCAAAPTGLLEHDETVCAIYAAYLRWLVTQDGPDDEWSGGPGTGWLLGVPELDDRRAPGRTCLSALRTGRPGSTDAPLNDSKGCGGVMRVAPIGFAHYDDPFELAVEAAALTHGHPSGYLSAGVLASVIGALAHGTELRDAIDIARRELVERPGNEETLHAMDEAVALAAEPGPPTPERVESLGGAWVGEEALAIALYCAVVASDVRSGLLLAVNHGGDSDSTGAITGNVLGATYGVDALPSDLLDGLELRDVIETVANDLADVFVDGRRPDPQRYPPA